MCSRHRLLLVAVAAISICAIAVSIIGVADDSDATLIEKDGVFYDLYEDDYHAEVITPFVGTYSGHIEIAATIEYDGHTYTVDTICGYTFQGCTGLTSIDLNGVKTIGEGAFEGCTGLTSIDLKNVTNITNYAFKDCTGLKTVDLKGVTTIGYNAFYGCTGITEFRINGSNTSYSVDNGVLFSYDGTELIKYTCGSTDHQYTVPNGTTNISDCAFSGCTSLTSIDLNNVTTIGGHAFEGCTGLTSIDLTGSSTVKNNTFSGCTGLTTVDLNGVTTIDTYAFEGCTGLTSIDLTGVENVNSEAFRGCTGLTSMDIKNVTYIGMGAFMGCTGLTEFKINGSTDGSNTSYSVVGGVLFNSAKTELFIYPCGKDSSYAVPDDVIGISSYAFRDCTNLTSIDLNEVTTIYSKTFEGCTSLKSVDLRAVTQIDNEAFKGCTGLTEFKINGSTDGSNTSYSVVGGVLFNSAKTELVLFPCGRSGTYSVPDNVTKICSYAFEDCTGLTSIDVNEVTTISNYTFGNCTGLTSMDLKGITMVNSNAFRDCTGLKSVDLKNVTTISDEAFLGCTGLTEFKINGSTDGSNTSYSVDNGVLFDSAKTELVLFPCGRSGEYKIPDNVTSIGDGAFYECTGLTSIDLKGVTTVGIYSFYGCTGLKYADLTGVKNIMCSFVGCTSLTSVALDDAEMIYDASFSGCTNLKKVTLPSVVPTVGQNLFTNSSPDIVLLVPSSASLDAYLASEAWMPYVNYTFADISKADVSGIIDKTYCGSAIEQTLTLTECSKTLAVDADYTISYSDNVNAGIAKVIITGKGNYAGTSVKTFNIIPKSVIVKANDVTRSYGEKDPELTATVTGLIGTDTVSYTLTRDSGESVGTYTIRASGDAVQGNYAVTYEDGTLTITEAVGKHYDWYYFLWLIPAIQFLFLVLILIYRTMKRDEKNE